MRALGLLIAPMLLAGTVGLAAAQSSGDVPNGNGQLSAPTNPKTPVFITRPNPTGPFQVVPPGTSGSRETNPFTDEPHSLNNAHPMQPNAGLGYAVRRVWIPPQPVAMQVYVPAPAGIPGRYHTMFARVPGFYVTETTTGVWLPERWVVDQVNVGVYRWRIAPMQFVPNGQ
jgi:hypothetical protein